MKKLLMIISAALFMVACGGGECDSKKECTGKDKKECTKGDKEGCKKDCKKDCCKKDAAHEGHEGHHGEEGKTCKPGCSKACCAKPLLDSNNNPVLDENGKEVMVNKDGDVITEEFIIEDAVEVVTEH